MSALGAGAVALLEPQARGLRPLHPEHVAALKESVREWGLLDYRWFAVLRDQHGRILSGRHRLAAARELGLRWPTVTIAVSDDAVALELALVANIHKGWSAADWRRQDLGALDSVGATRFRELIRAARRHRCPLHTTEVPWRCLAQPHGMTGWPRAA